MAYRVIYSIKGTYDAADYSTKKEAQRFAKHVKTGKGNYRIRKIKKKALPGFDYRISIFR